MDWLMRLWWNFTLGCILLYKACIEWWANHLPQSKAQEPVIEADRPYRFANDGTPIYGYQPRNSLLDRPMNHALEIIVNKNGKPPQSITSDVIAGAPIGRYIPATDTWQPAPYVKDEFDMTWPRLRETL